MTETISAIESITRTLKEVKAVGKDSRNATQGFNYRGIDAVVNAVHPILAKVGGVIIPTIQDQSVEHATTSKGNAMVVVRLRVEYAWHGTDGGEPIRAVVSSEAFDTADKATAKAWSVALRTYLLQTLMLPTDDPDPDSTYIERGRPYADMAETIKAAVAAIGAATDGKTLGSLTDLARERGIAAVDVVVEAFDKKRAELGLSTAADWKPDE